MEHIDTFTWITGLATLVGLGIQLLDLFPRAGRWRALAFAFLLGVFLGSILRAFDSSQITIKIEVTKGTILLGIFGIVTLVFLSAAAFTRDARRGEFYIVSIIAGFCFVMTAIGVAASSSDHESPDFQQLSVSELNLLAERAIATEDLERAISRLQAMEYKVRYYDIEQAKVVDERIQDLRRKEMALSPTK